MISLIVFNDLLMLKFERFVALLFMKRLSLFLSLSLFQCNCDSREFLCCPHGLGLGVSWLDKVAIPLGTQQCIRDVSLEERTYFGDTFSWCCLREIILKYPFTVDH